MKNMRDGQGILTELLRRAVMEFTKLTEFLLEGKAGEFLDGINMINGIGKGREEDNFG